MIKKLFEKHETICVIALIVIYVAVNSVCLQSFDTTDIRCALINTAFSVSLLGLIIYLKKTSYYGLKRVKEVKKYLFFLPLLLIASLNLWGGIHINNTLPEIIFHFITMLNVGWIEEMIFRGFLYKMMEKNAPRSAAIISALTFGVGHIVNLLNGAEILPTLLQLGYATAIGWLFVMIYKKSGSLVPCIIAHGSFNALSVFSVESEPFLWIGSTVLIILSLGYAFYIDKAIKTEDLK